MRSRFVVATMLAALLATAATAVAQEHPVDLLDGVPASTTVSDLVSSTPLAGPVDPREYEVGPGDVFQLHFSGSFTRSLVLPVGPEGAVYLPGVGAVPVAGRTLEDAKAVVLARLRGQYRGVAADISLARTRLMQVFLTGPNVRSGPMLVAAGSHLSDVLADTLLGPGASRRAIHIERRAAMGAPSVPDRPADLVRFRLNGDRRFDPMLRDGDVIHVPVATRFVAVDGAVGHPATFELGAQDSLGTLVRLAGGTLPSATSTALFVRFRSATQRESLQVALADVTSGTFDPPLRDGDHLYVYYQPRFHEAAHVGITGEVAKPGSYPIEPGRTHLSQLIGVAGGFLDRADLTAIRVFRSRSTATERDPELERLLGLARQDMTASEYALLRARLAARNEDFRVDWNRMTADAALDLVLEDGDVVRVDPVFPAVRVDGEVRHPGMLNFVAGESISDCIARCGGYTNRAWAGKVRVIRAVTGQTLLARNVQALGPGDFIWVPERPDVTTWEQMKDVLGVLAQAATIIIAIRSVR